ncbi:putative FHA domain protein SNIP1 [Aspergillus affinis]|uniref:putative FHA domain protein SNIP1 n=1 Tax=Aspergillus affinis TaxID=1070780 RepID=UPI0022FF4020|nr:SMAD/FHA domain-containing protein [Aspergillus affinis]KAI9041262.1 SMAD/FHA domain-containing protein [Aspergillus affinis]
MAESPDGYRDRKRHRSPRDSPGPSHDRDRRRRGDDDHESSSRRRDDHRSSRRDSPRRKSSRSPSGRSSHHRDSDRRRRECRDRDRSPDDDRRRRRHRSPDERRSHRRHRDRDGDDDRKRDRERERPSRRHRSTSHSRSPARRSRSPPSREVKRSRGPLPSQNDAYKSEVPQGGDSVAPPVEKEKPNFGNTGRLAAESNTVAVNGESVVLKYHEPPEARKPPGKEPWRLYVFKGEDLLEVVQLNERSCWLIGRERLVVDFPLDHPSCSKQHAALQFRFVDKRNEFGDRIGKVKPYLIDLESANGSSVNGEPVPGGRYVEVRDKDVLKFGLSSREYVLMLPPPE